MTAHILGSIADEYRSVSNERQSAFQNTRTESVVTGKTTITTITTRSTSVSIWLLLNFVVSFGASSFG